jgi:hypothetical protein
VVQFAVLPLRRGPTFPAILLVEDERILLPLKLGFVGLILLQPIQVFQEQQPRGLLGVIQLGRTAGLFSKHVVDILERLLKHRHLVSLRTMSRHRI